MFKSTVESEIKKKKEKQGKIQEKNDKTKTKHIKVTLNWNVQLYQILLLDRSCPSICVFVQLVKIYMYTYIYWRRKWQPIPVFLPGKFHGQKSLVGYSPWGHKEPDTTEHTHTHTHTYRSREKNTSVIT